jgi:hypothetical protein
LLAVLVAAPAAFAAAPRIILVTGGGLARPAVLADWQENLAIMQSASNQADAKSEDLATRPSYRVAMFWDPGWDHYMRARKDPSALRLKEANQFAHYYPPTATHGAVFAFDGIPGADGLTRKLDDQGVAIFSRHGITSQALSPKAISGSLPANTSHPWAGPTLPRALIVVLGGAACVAGLWLTWLVLRRRPSS